MRRSFLCALLVLSATAVVFSQDTNFASGPQYLMTGSPLFARSVATPSLSLAGPPLETGASNATGGMVAGGDNQTLSSQQAEPASLLPIYYGRSPTIGASSAEPSELSLTELPTSILDTGVSLTSTAQSLRERGNGVTLGVAASYRKAHPERATHVYINADIERLRGGG
jgi:hypothetical protein